MKTAWSYLRVSTTRQVNKAYNPEGYSLPAQRDANQRKAAELDAEIAVEFIERGETGRTVDRPEFQRMLTLLKDTPPDYLIVHKLDRWARNLTDDVLLRLEIRKTGVQLVSATEHIDETPTGRMLHGILATMNEFYSANLAAEVGKGMSQKAEQGGTPGLAPIGYLNAEERLPDGRVVRTVVVDPERAPFIRLAFELYATGDYGLYDLMDELTERGFRTRPNKHHSGKPVSLTQISRILNNPYYVGDVTFRGVVYAGHHQPLVTRQLFDRVQDVLAAHLKAGEREWIHSHYLKGTVYCGRCGSRLCLTLAKGQYLYFFCLGRHKGNGCDLQYLPAEAVEDKVAELYKVPQVPPDELAAIRADLHAHLSKEHRQREREATRQRRRLAGLEDERRKLLRAHLADAIPLDLLKTEQDRIQQEMAQAKRQVERAEADYGEVMATFDQAAMLLADLDEAGYWSLPPISRRLINQTLFERIMVHQDLETTVERTELAQGFEDARPTRQPRYQRRSTANTESLSGARCSNVLLLERVTGIEPASRAWKARALPLSYTRVAARRVGRAWRPGARERGHDERITRGGVLPGRTGAAAWAWRVSARPCAGSP